MSDLAGVDTAGTTVTDSGVSQNSPQVEAQPEKRYKLKINGVEEDHSESDVIRYAQKSRAGDKYLQEAKAARKQLEARESKLFSDEQQYEERRKLPATKRMEHLFEDIQDDPQAIKELWDSLENRMLAKIEEESAGPESQRALKAERELERMKKERENYDERVKEAQWKRSVEAQRPEQERAVMEVFKVGKIPVTEWNVKSVADIHINLLRKGIKPDPQKVADYLKEDRIDNIRAFSSSLTKQVLDAYSKKDATAILAAGESLVEMMGIDLIKAVRAYDMQLVEKRRPSSQRQETHSPSPVEPVRGMSFEEAQDERRKRAQAMSR